MTAVLLGVAGCGRAHVVEAALHVGASVLLGLRVGGVAAEISERSAVVHARCLFRADEVGANSVTELAQSLAIVAAHAVAAGASDRAEMARLVPGHERGV